MNKNCPVDGSPMRHVFDHAVLNRHVASYFSCGACGLMQVASPHWLENLYSEEITDLDPWVGIRNVVNARRLEPILALLFPRDSVFVEDACGYGLLTRLLRDAGFQAYGEDPYCKSIFCERFRPPAGVRAAAVLAFEVLEHVMDPVSFIRDRMARFGARAMIASTTVFEGAPPDPCWQYYAFETGQHVSFYQPGTLQAIARGLGLHYFRPMADLHVFSADPIPGWKVHLLRARHVAPMFARWVQWRRKGLSLTQSDYEAGLREMKAMPSPGRTSAPDVRTPGGAASESRPAL